MEPHATAPVARPRLFYGWVIVGIALVTGAFTTGVGVWGFSVFVTPMEETLGWSRPTFYAALTIRSIVGAVGAPFIGPFLDRPNGPRLLLLVTAVTMGGSLAALRLVEAPWQFHLLFGGLGGLFMLGAGPTITQTVLPKWFVVRRGRALSIASMGTGFGALLGPTTAHLLVSALGWRDAWLAVGVATFLVLGPAALLLRTRPEEMGLHPDGLAPGAQPPGGRRAARPEPQRSYTRGQALRTPAFWAIAGAFSLVAAGINGFHPNLVPYFEDIGLGAATGSYVVSFFGVFSITARVVWGFLGDRIPLRPLVVINLALVAAAVFSILLISSRPVAFLFAACYGITFGGYLILQPLLVANYFGREHLGAINGVLRPFLTTANAISPLMVSTMYAAQGSYTGAFLAVGSAWAVAAVAVLVGVRAPGAAPAPAPAARSRS